MFQYSYGNGGSVVVDDPNLNDLLSAVCCSAGQPINTSPTNHPFFVDGELAFPASSSLPSSNDYLLQRSRSTHSLANHAGIPDPVPVNPFYYSSSPPVSSACDFLDFHHADTVRRVYSAGDLQGMNSMQVSAENCTTQEGITAAGRVGRYTAEERKERIDRYRSKRNQRNFHKKITYACRKTLADSRPRVRGRFARNGENETEVEPESSETSFECYSYGTCDNGGSHNNSGNSASGEGEWWKQMQAALPLTTTDEEECCYDEDIWASLDSVFSVNLLS